MTPAEGIAYLQGLPADEPIVVIRPRERKKQRIERDKKLAFRVPASLREAFMDMLNRVGAKIGSQRSEDRLDWVLATINLELDRDDLPGEDA